MEDLKDLIRSAFEQARASGKADWRRMSIAVLKNRMLELTDRKFSERQYGARTFRDLVAGAVDVVRLDTTVYPAVAELLEPTGESVAAGPGPEPARTRPWTRVRSDLWNAMMDTPSGRRFVWDAKEEIARESASIDPPDIPILPTVSAEEMAAWRAEFAKKYELDPAAAEKLAVWQKHRLSSTVLPPAIRGEWLTDLKRRVENRLRTWFRDQKIVEPPDLLTGKTDDRGSLQALREVVTECVAVMTERELSELNLPASAILRARSKRES